MNKKNHSGVFMMEMISVVFFFILCASICILIFVKSDKMSRDAASLNQSVMIAQSVAEIWKAEGPEGLEERLMAQDMGSGSYVYIMQFDEKGEQVSGNQAVYQVTVALPGDEKALETDVIVSRAEETVYQLHVTKHETAE